MPTSKKESINTNVKKLNDLIKYFEAEDKQLNLEADLEKYEEAIKLVAAVKDELESFELKIDEIKGKYMNEE